MACVAEGARDFYEEGCRARGNELDLLYKSGVEILSPGEVGGVEGFGVREGPIDQERQVSCIILNGKLKITGLVYADFIIVDVADAEA